MAKAAVPAGPGLLMKWRGTNAMLLVVYSTTLGYVEHADRCWMPPCGGPLVDKRSTCAWFSHDGTDVAIGLLDAALASGKGPQSPLLCQLSMPVSLCADGAPEAARHRSPLGGRQGGVLGRLLHHCLLRRRPRMRAALLGPQEDIWHRARLLPRILPVRAAMLCL
jgi:hypothetical protein